LEDEPFAEWTLRQRDQLEWARQEARLALARDRARGLGGATPDGVVQHGRLASRTTRLLRKLHLRWCACRRARAGTHWPKRLTDVAEQRWKSWGCRPPPRWKRRTEESAPAVKPVDQHRVCRELLARRRTTEQGLSGVGPQSSVNEQPLDRQYSRCLRCRAGNRAWRR
jgi:hypothetical protein